MTGASFAGALADRYRIDRVLGAGGMATVYLAHDVKHDRRVALKVLRPELAAMIGADRFLREIKTTANLQHPHILALHDSGRVDGTVYYVMPYVEGESLRHRLLHETQLPIDDALRIAREVASALDYAHRHGVIHRDIKPENILLHDGQALVADFGIALAAAGSTSDSRLTETGMSLGTPYYMSPEQALGERTVDARTDIYALGCVLHEMLAGEPPFTGPSAQAILGRAMTEAPRALRLLRRSIPAHVEAAVQRALEKLPADRFQTAAQLADALTGAGSAGRITEATDGRPVVGHAPRRRIPGWLATPAVPWLISAALLLALAWIAPPREPATASVAGPIRFMVDFGAEAWPAYSPIVLLDPTGRRLFMAATIAGRGEILLWRFDRLGMAPIRGATQASGGAGFQDTRPFLSPDGRWIAYSSEGKLRKVPVDGGPAIDLATSAWAGGSWSKDGRLIYTQFYNSGLWIVSEAGGDARALTTPDTSRRELGHWWPQVLPGGKRVLFTAYRTPLEEATIEILSLDSGERQVVVTGGVFGRYVPTGHLLYAIGETVRAVPFDLARLEVTGAAVVVVDSVAMNPADASAGFDVSAAGTLAYLPADAYAPDLDLVLVDRRGGERLALPAPARYDSPRLSPDGARIAVDIRSPVSKGDVWVYQLGRSSGTPVTAGGGLDWGAEWTPDGRELIYISERPQFELYRRAADASRPAEPLVTGEYDRFTGAVSHDGRLLAFVLSVPGAAEIWTTPLQGKPTPARYLANGSNLAHPTISPDGRWMAYDSDESGRIEVYMQSFPDPSDRRWKVSSSGGSEPIWTRQGRELVFRRGDTVMAVTVDSERGQSGQPVALFGGPYLDNPGWRKPRSYDVSRDGERFLMLKLPPKRIRRRVHVVLNWFDELRGTFPR